MRLAGTARAEAVDAATPRDRDRLIDFLRASSLVVVVLGHWLMAGVAVGADGRIAGVNALSTVLVLQPLTWLLQVMPLFFVAGGFSNLTTWRRQVARGGGDGGYPAFVRARLLRLTGPALVFVGVVQAGLILLRQAGLGAAEAELAGRLLGQPLWFLGVYVVVTALAPAMAAWHARAPVGAIVVLASSAVAVDVARVGAGAEAVGYLNLGLVWLIAAQVGFWYADGRLAGIGRRQWWAVLVAAAGALVLLTGPGPYPLSMVGVPGELSNMSPPTVCILVLIVGQVAAVMLARRRLQVWLADPRRWSLVVSIGSLAMTVYLWHLAVLVAAFGAVVWLGWLPPEPGSGWWWLTRPAWLAGLGLVLVVLSAAASGVRRRLTASTSRRGRAGPEPAGLEPAATPAATIRFTASVTAVALTALGLLGFVASGLAPSSPWSSVLLFLPVDPVQNTLFLTAGLLLVRRSAR